MRTALGLRSAMRQTWTAVECEGKVWTADTGPGSIQAGMTREVASIYSSAVISEEVTVDTE